MLDQEKEASVTTATPKRLQVLLCNRLRELEDDYEINGSVAGKGTAIPRLSIY
jgi:hypothetical protein